MHLRTAIAPHFFQFVKFSCVRMHYMYHNIHIIDQHPLKRLAAFVFIRPFSTAFLYLVFHKIADGLYLCGAGGFTNYNEISRGLGYLPKVKAHDIFPLLILYGFDDGFKNL